MPIGTRVRFAAVIAVAIAVAGALVYLAQSPTSVVVAVVNDSDKPVGSVRVEHELGVASIDGLEKGQEKTVALSGTRRNLLQPPGTFL